jgi:hypothetical protein
MSVCVIFQRTGIFTTINLRPTSEMPLHDHKTGMWCVITAAQLGLILFLKHYWLQGEGRHFKHLL